MRVSIKTSDSSAEELEVANGVADAFVNRAAANLSNIYEAFLQKIGYHFAEPEDALVLNDTPDDTSVVCFESEMGRMPLLAGRWYRRIRSVNFIQADQQFTDSGSPLAGLGWNTPLIFQSLDKAREHWKEHCNRSARDRRFREQLGFKTETPSFPMLLTGGSASNNDCKGINLPSFKFDDVLYNNRGW